MLILDKRHEVHVVLTPDDEDPLPGVTVGIRVFQNVEQIAALDVEDDVLEPDLAIARRPLDRESFRYQKCVWWLPAAAKTGAVIGARLSLVDPLGVCYEPTTEDERAMPLACLIRRGQAGPEELEYLLATDDSRDS